LILGPRTVLDKRQKTISFSRTSMSISFALQKYVFPRGLALRLQRVHYVHPIRAARYHLVARVGPLQQTKRTRPPTHLTLS
jgi:hypothetical protein